MATETTHEIDRPLDEVWDRLVDAAAYPEWLVGAKRVVRVDEEWPREGSTFSHRIGIRPWIIPGSTTVEAVDPPRCLVLRAGMGVLGEMRVTFELARSETDPSGTVVHMTEQPSGGVMRLAGTLLFPVVMLGLWGRNSLSLDRLGEVVAAG